MKKVLWMMSLLLVSAMWVSCGQDSPEEPQDPDTPSIVTPGTDTPADPEKPDTPSEPEEPVDPSQLPQEDWELSFCNYTDTGCDREYCEQKGRIYYRNVKIARNNDKLYIKGIFKEYPDSWVKATVYGDELKFENGQILGYTGMKPVYFHWGTTWEEFSGGNTYHQLLIFFETVRTIPFKISEDGKNMSVDCTEHENYKYYYGAFWYNEDAEGDECLQEFTKTYYTEDGIPFDEKDPFPEKDFMINMCFKKL